MNPFMISYDLVHFPVRINNEGPKNNGIDVIKSEETYAFNLHGLNKEGPEGPSPIGKSYFPVDLYGLYRLPWPKGITLFQSNKH